jgi:NADPH:quinone reductase-like Zn-dependent oxidoreductase
MKAVVFHGKNDLRVEDVPVPKIQPGRVMVRRNGSHHGIG